MRKIRRRINENTDNITRKVNAGHGNKWVGAYHNPVMVDAADFDLRTRESIDKELKEMDRLPERHKPFIGAKNQPLPKRVDESRKNIKRQKRLMESTDAAETISRNNNYKYQIARKVEKELPHNMRYKEFDLSKDYERDNCLRFLWVTQEPFTEDEARDFFYCVEDTLVQDCFDKDVDTVIVQLVLRDKYRGRKDDGIIMVYENTELKNTYTESIRNRKRKRGLSEAKEINSWHDAYSEFIKIVDKYFPNEDEIESRVYDLAMSHYGEAIWDKAYDRWIENSNDEELQEEFNAGNFYGIKGIKMIDHGVNRDPEVQYKGRRYNYYMIEDSLWDMCRNECKENDIPFNEDIFSKWVRNNPDIVKELLDNSIRESRHSRFNRKSINEADIKDFSNKEDKAQKEQNADYWNRVYQELCPDDPHWADGRYAVRTIYKNINPRKRFKSDDLRLDMENNIIYIKDSVKPELVDFAKQVADDYERYMVQGKKNGVQEDELFGIIMPDEDEEMSDELVTKINTIYKDWENI